MLRGDGSKITNPETFLERKGRKILRKFIENYKDVLQSKPDKMKCTCMEIERGCAYSSHMRAYRIALKKVPLLEEEIKLLLWEGIIQPSNSQWTFPKNVQNLGLPYKVWKQENLSHVLDGH